MYTYGMREHQTTATTDCACLTARQAARALTRRYEQILQPSGLRIGQYALLAALLTAGEATISELALRLDLDRTTLTRELKPLQQQAWLTVRRGPDPRTRVVSATAAGEAVWRSAVPLWQQAQRDAALLLGETRWQALFGIARAIVDATPSG